MITTINFKHKGKPFKWTFDHNLDEFGISIDAAFINWSVRLNLIYPNQADFCKYVVSKDLINFKCKIK